MATETPSTLPTLELTEVETLLQRLLLDVASSIDSDPPLELRFTGGWVRDKLLGVGSHDIDVAINVMTGYEFGLRMKAYLEIPGNTEKYVLKESVSYSNGDHAPETRKMFTDLHKIAANPEKSKHLETVTTRVFGLDVDLVNLRKETYTEDSRNPQMEFGTPEEDAMRRDATVNAMFYNLTSNQVEDFTGRGFSDMDAKLIRTPLEPHQTFMDDPLRVLRLIRFASRLGYTIDPDVEASMSDEAIKKALKIKISRERVGVEVEKTLKGPDPLLALKLIDRLTLYETIFADPTVESKFSPSVDEFKLAYQTVDALLHSEQTPVPLKRLMQSEEDFYQAWLLSAYATYADAPIQASKKPPLATDAAREGIKAPNKICDLITASVRNLDDIVETKNKCLHRLRYPNRPVADVDPAGRDTLGISLRRWGPTWRHQLVYALLAETTRSTASIHDLFEGYGTFVQKLMDLDLMDVCNVKSLIDGKSLAKALNMRPGPWMKDAMEVVMAWQLRNPNVTNPTEALEQVRLSLPNSELAEALARHFLSLTIRPLFAQAHNTGVTDQGRRARPSDHPARKHDILETEAETKPWKAEKAADALHSLRWVVSGLTHKTTESNWPLLLPPVLSLIDDSDVKYKVMGCELLTMLLERTAPTLLTRTGIDSVMRDALEPCLEYLPTLTPEADSIAILNAAYPAMLKLFEQQFSPSSESTTGSTTTFPPTAPHINALSTLLHKHLISSLAYTTSHPQLQKTLLTYIKHTLAALQLNAIGELKPLVPLFDSILSQPYIAHYAPLVTSAAQALHQLILCTWPRIWRWRANILHGLSAAWFEVQAELERSSGDARSDETRKELENAAEQLNECAIVLLEACKAVVDKDDKSSTEQIDINAEVALLVDAEPRLQGLLSPRTGTATKV